MAAEDTYVTTATKTAKKTAAKKPAAKKAVPVQRQATAEKVTPAKKATAKRVVRERKLGAVVMSVVEEKPRRTRARKPAAVVVAAAAAQPTAPSVQLAVTKAARPLVAKERARRKVTLPFRERLEAAMHRELKHVGPVCHPCRMNASRLAALATS